MRGHNNFGFPAMRCYMSKILSHFRTKHKFFTSKKSSSKSHRQEHKCVDNAYCPCQFFSLISINDKFDSTKNYTKKQFELETTVQNFINYFGRNHVAFFTLTFNSYTDFDTAQKKWDSFNTNVFSKRFKHWIYATEPHKNGSVHKHFVVSTDFDMKPDSFPWGEVAKRNYKNVDPRIREEWRFWNSITGFKVVDGKKVPKNAYNIGRTEFRPLKGDSMQAAAYIGKYVSKTLSSDSKQSSNPSKPSKFAVSANSNRKRFKTVGYSKSVLALGLRTVTKDFSWVACSGRTPQQWYRHDFKTGELMGGVKYRKRCAELANNLKDLGLITIASPEGMKTGWNRRWAWQFRGFILGKGSVSSDFVIDQMYRSLQTLDTKKTPADIDDIVFNLTKLLRWGGVAEEKIEEYEDRYLDYDKFMENEREERIKAGERWAQENQDVDFEMCPDLTFDLPLAS